MRVAVLKETRSAENRVALVPLGVKSLVKRGLTVTVQTGAGETSGVSDLMYRDAGAEIAASARETLEDAKLILVVNPPSSNELAHLSEGSILVGFLDPLSDPDLVSRLIELKVTGISMELVPRITRAQSMDALSSQATVAGYKAVLLAANHLPKFLPMFTTAAGTIRPAKALILGAGVAGLQAIATARRLGAIVEAFDVRPAVKEQVESLGASFLESEEEVTAEGEGGYAKELTEDQHSKELELIGSALIDTDIVITTAQIPGRKAPVLITEDMVKTMKYGSVIVDLAAESGGNCELSEAGETVLAHGVQILGPSNLPTSIPVHSSQMYSKNIVTLISEFISDDGQIQLDFENDVVGPSTVTHGGEVQNERVQSVMRSNNL
ncbi:MAG: Re/Si-specific NAD(P)(+) transhydrogenase subunit alpha [Gemmatimonadota bacterium]|uniref:proton-translocating NAD(P)(+) transhydrogenase n=1 Tax=marine metagenome TaxID=408172 RepID=A0A381NA61_9ZZZZ|nr:Re/Si-specific NAD(P)(+) transhydrogenase subunit alpha [Gemmatimonadota bacterium]MEE3136380.1 Re/Si-specific NAD(P)(+) transhydrogenase subunit alpha [Gemmatimonadota bacterium]|tara:strand:- start:3881 stop:5023 length:1143 start_codon:yes stop_codon:yes gene_type:complete